VLGHARKLPFSVEAKVTAPKPNVISASPGKPAPNPLPDAIDSFGDGTPDFLRLADAADRENFRKWFTLIAESQYYGANKLPPGITDCASLLRFSYREALTRHDSAWTNRIYLAAAPQAGELRSYHYPHTALGSNLFRTRSGEFAQDDLTNGVFAEFADAKTLWLDNTHIVGRSLRAARPGDLLFFRQSRHDLPFHAMIFLGASQVEPSGEQFVTYHTGPDGSSPGEMRRLSIAELMNYPDARWRPVESNPAFLGVYRWNILRGGE
jgi:uncharacterized protein YfaT (DUF1175 family)